MNGVTAHKTTAIP